MIQEVRPQIPGNAAPLRASGSDWRLSYPSKPEWFQPLNLLCLGLDFAHAKATGPRVRNPPAPMDRVAIDGTRQVPCAYACPPLWLPPPPVVTEVPTPLREFPGSLDLNTLVNFPQISTDPAVLKEVVTTRQNGSVPINASIVIDVPVEEHPREGLRKNQGLATQPARTMASAIPAPFRTQ